MMQTRSRWARGGGGDGIDDTARSLAQAALDGLGAWTTTTVTIDTSQAESTALVTVPAGGYVHLLSMQVTVASDAGTPAIALHDGGEPITFANLPEYYVAPALDPAELGASATWTGWLSVDGSVLTAEVTAAAVLTVTVDDAAAATVTGLGCEIGGAAVDLTGVTLPAVDGAALATALAASPDIASAVYADGVLTLTTAAMDAAGLTGTAITGAGALLTSGGAAVGTDALSKSGTVGEVQAVIAWRAPA